MKAVLLAAGVGMRLRPYTERHPKCLVPIGGRALLDRHLDILSGFREIEGLCIVVGYRADQIRDAVATWKRDTRSPFPIELVQNEHYTKGSILSLYAARDTLRSADAVIMDADVLYPPELMRRLIESAHPNCFLVDENARETGEEMMVCVRGGRALMIARSRDPITHGDWDTKGEGVGFFRLARAHAPALLSHIERLLAEGQDTVEYEVALAKLMAETECGTETIGDLPWTEIDFEEDIARAEAMINIGGRCAPQDVSTGAPEGRRLRA
jgi:choline kinase